MTDTGEPLIDELYRAIEIRCDALESIISDLQGSVPKIQTSLHRAYDIAREVPSAVRHKAEEDIQSARSLLQAREERSTRSTLLSLRALLKRLRYVTDFIEDHFMHGDRPDLSQALMDQLSRELSRLGYEYDIVISHGPSNNFITRYCNLRHQLLGKDLFRQQQALQATAQETQHSKDNPDSTDKPEVDFALFQIPRTEGSQVYWKPILLGHEVAHASYRYGSEVFSRLCKQYDPIARLSSFSRSKSRYSDFVSDSERHRKLAKIANAWTKELLCDAYSLHRFGPSSIVSLAEFLTTVGTMATRNNTHPPGNFRVSLMMRWIGYVDLAEFNDLLSRWKPTESFDSGDSEDDRGNGSKHRESSTGTDPNEDSEIQQILLLDFFDTIGDELFDLVQQAYPACQYDTNHRKAHIKFVTKRLLKGIPGGDVLPETHERIRMPDIVNASWVARAEQSRIPIDVLAGKAIEDDVFLDTWIDNGGTLPSLDEGEAQNSNLQDVLSNSRDTLSEVSLNYRLNLVDDAGGIVITPLLQRPAGAALDLRLGNKFISFRRSVLSSFDPIDSNTDPRSIQVYRELSWTEHVVLHPHELMLASTLEYLALPDDVTAHVITRSSYGRLGLLSATAVQVHPSFYGCLTLELVNLSNLPLVLTPGERIVQLVAWTTDPVPSPDDDEEVKNKYHFPVGPEFSKVRRDPETDVLRRIRGLEPGI